MDGSLAWQDRFKHRLLHRANNIAISQAIADSLPVPATVVGDPYDVSLFRLLPEVPRDRDLVFLGRLVSDKGVDLLLAALVNLGSRGLQPRLTVIGSGSEASQLKKMAAQLGLAGQVEWFGPKQGPDLVTLLNRHRIMVVPSRWREPFGVVALEGLACGCVVVGSEGGGLRDAIGPCGLTFPNGNVPALADRLAELLTAPDRLAHFRSETPAHLEKFHPTRVAQAYIKIFESALRSAR
jgi:glycosyltransferase involved in cell wall biosynthesis